MRSPTSSAPGPTRPCGWRPGDRLDAARCSRTLVRRLRRTVRPRGARGRPRRGRRRVRQGSPRPALRGRADELHRTYSGRPSILTEVPRFAEHAGGARVLLKREDLNHTGSHKINNVLGQALLAKRMGKGRIIAETGAGQHGVASATAAALMGMSCTVYMGEEDTRRQALNVARMRLLGAEVVAVRSGSRTLKDAINEAFRDWVANVDDTFYLFGTAAGPHPFPAMVRDFQQVIGIEARAQVLELTGRLPDVVAACVGGGSNALGIFHAFYDDAEVELLGLEAAGDGVSTGRHAASISGGDPACCTAPGPSCCRTRTARPSRATRSRPGWTTRASAPSTPGCTPPGGPGTRASPTPRRWTPWPCSAVPRGSSRRSRARTRSPVRCARAPAWAGVAAAGQPVRSRRQGRRHRRPLVRAARRGHRGPTACTPLPRLPGARPVDRSRWRPAPPDRVAPGRVAWHDGRDGVRHERAPTGAPDRSVGARRGGTVGFDAECRPAVRRAFGVVGPVGPAGRWPPGARSASPRPSMPRCRSLSAPASWQRLGRPGRRATVVRRARHVGAGHLPQRGARPATLGSPTLEVSELVWLQHEPVDGVTLRPPSVSRPCRDASVSGAARQPGACRSPRTGDPSRWTPGLASPVRSTFAAGRGVSSSGTS